MTQGYREEKGGTFESNGVKYDLNYILAHVEKEPIQQIAVKELVWVIKYSGVLDEEKIERADLKAPLLVTKYRGLELAVDGIHRLVKAVREGKKHLPYRRVSTDIMKGAIVRPGWTYWEFTDTGNRLRRKSS